jgi:hypothetical protein
MQTSKFRLAKFTACAVVLTSLIGAPAIDAGDVFNGFECFQFLGTGCPIDVPNTPGEISKCQARGFYCVVGGARAEGECHGPSTTACKVIVQFPDCGTQYHCLTIMPIPNPDGGFKKCPSYDIIACATIDQVPPDPDPPGPIN